MWLAMAVSTGVETAIGLFVFFVNACKIHFNKIVYLYMRQPESVISENIGEFRLNLVSGRGV
jgi:Na+-transporting NADH:ubiquinone oxidoreductase subunit NqrE